MDEERAILTFINYVSVPSVFLSTYNFLGSTYARQNIVPFRNYLHIRPIKKDHHVGVGVDVGVGVWVVGCGWNAFFSTCIYETRFVMVKSNDIFLFTFLFDL